MIITHLLRTDNARITAERSHPAANAIAAAAAAGANVLQHPSNSNELFIGPYLDGNEISNVTVQVGTNAYLPCKVRADRNHAMPVFSTTNTRTHNLPFRSFAWHIDAQSHQLTSPHLLHLRLALKPRRTKLRLTFLSRQTI